MSLAYALSPHLTGCPLKFQVGNPSRFPPASKLLSRSGSQPFLPDSSFSEACALLWVEVLFFELLI